MTHRFEMNAPDSPRICRHCGKSQDDCTGVDTMPEETRAHIRETLELLTLGATRELPDWKEALVALEALIREIRVKVDGDTTRIEALFGGDPPDPITLPDLSEELSASLKELAESTEMDDEEDAEDFVDSWTRAFHHYALAAVTKDRLDRRSPVDRVATRIATKADLAKLDRSLFKILDELRADLRTIDAVKKPAIEDDEDEDFDPDDPRFVELHDRLTSAGSFPNMSASEGHELSEFIDGARNAARAARAR